MFYLMRSKLEGLKRDFKLFQEKAMLVTTPQAVTELLITEMKRLNYDEVFTDISGNVYGVLRGYHHGNDLMLMSHADTTTRLGDAEGKESVFTSFLNWDKSDWDMLNRTDTTTVSDPVLTQIYSAILLKRCILPMNGDIIVSCAVSPVSQVYSRSQILINKVLSRPGCKISNILLGEPTSNNVYIGSKGRLEYRVNIQLTSENGSHKNPVNLLAGIYPALNTLKEFAGSLPENNLVGRSKLSITNIDYKKPSTKRPFMNYDIFVDRMIIPEEAPQKIIGRAENGISLAYHGQKVYTEKTVAVKICKENVSTDAGKLSILKQIPAWNILSKEEYVLSSMEALKNLDLRPEIGFWKERVTDGAYTFGELKIPTVGYGPGSELNPGPNSETSIEESILGGAAIIQNTIGFPAFGWSSDEI